MRFNPGKRFFLACVYLGALFLICGWLLYRIQHFDGALFVRAGMPERAAFRQAAGGLGLGVSQRAVPRDLIPFENPSVSVGLRSDQAYDSAVMPFFVRLDTVDILEERPPLTHIRVAGPGESEDHVVAPGDQIHANGDAFEFTGAGPWEGLVRVPAGKPMAAITAGESGMIFLDQGRWYIPRADLAVIFLWSTDEAALREATVQTIDDISFSRWGVRDGKAIQWFDSFAPGTGLRLRSGERVRLEEDRRMEGVIVLNVERGAAAEKVEVKANERDAATPYLLEMPARTGRVLMLHAWREDACIARLLRAGEAAEERSLSTGEVWNLAPDGISLRMEQVLDAAVAIPGNQVYAARLKHENRLYTVREGLTETIGDYRIAFRREQQPPVARYTFTVLDANGQPTESIALGPDDQERIGAWVFSLSDENPFAPEGVALRAVRRPGGPAQVLGLVLLVGGSIGLIVVRFGIQWEHGLGPRA